MVIKYKLNEVAKDFNMQSKELVEMLKGLDGEKKYTTQTSLGSDELDLVYELLTKKYEVESLDEFKAEARPMQAKPVPAQHEVVVVAHSEETVKAVEEAKKAAEQRPAQPQQKPAAPVKPTQQSAQPQRPQQQQQQRPQQQTKPAAQAQPSNQVQPSNQAQPQRPAQPANQTQQQRQQAQQDKFRQPQQRQPQKPAQQRPQQKPNQRPQQPIQGSAVIVREAPQAVDTGKKQRVVDTRSGHVDIERYNQHYDDLAATKSSSATEQAASKQKLNQKSQQYNRQKGKGRNAKRETEAERMKRIALERKLKPITVSIPEEISVNELALRMKIQAGELIKKLMLMGEMKAINDSIDYETAYLLATELGAKVEKEIVVSIEERIIDDSDDNEGNLLPRSPVVVVMGHVDHGKTSLLDYIRHSHVTEGEAGGITQHIGAYRVPVRDREITFLDTPGHEAFTTMRARGAQVTDIAVLVVAADDGIMPQTVEAINHAKAAGVSIIVAINKMDRPEARPDMVKQQLTEQGLVPEEWGGDIICVPVSAKTGMGVDSLLDYIILSADMRELKANPDRAAKGTVIEARLDKGRGPIATILVQNGTLHEHDVIVAGTSVGRVRIMTDDRGQRISDAGPSIPVEIVGLDSVPMGGDIFNAVSDEKLARELVEQRRSAQKEEVFQQQTKVTLDNLFSQMQEGEMKELKIIVKGDVMGSVEAVKQSLAKLSNEEVRVNIIHGAVGAVTESDVMLADASNAIIVGFNVRPDPVATEYAERVGVDLRLYRIIYDCIEELGSAMKGMLAPKTRVVDLGRAEVRQTIKISAVGTIAGCYVVSGKIERRAKIRVVRNGIIVAEDQIKSLRRFKDDVKEVAQSFECGIGLERFNDIKEGDFLEAFVVEEYRE